MRSNFLPYTWPRVVLRTLWQRRCSAPYTAEHPLPSPAVVQRMASRKEKRQDRQSRRPGSLNRRFTDDLSIEAAATTDAAHSPPAAAEHPAPSAEPYRLTQKEVALLNYISWKGRTGKPPPLTVFAEPSLQHVLRGLRQKQRRPLAAQDDDVQVVADLIHVPDPAQTKDAQAASTKLQPRPKKKHGSTTVAPLEIPRSSLSKRTTAISSDTSLEEMPAAPSEVAPSLPSQQATILESTLASPASADIAPPVSSEAELGRCPRPTSPTATSSFLAPPENADMPPPDMAQPRDQKPRASSPELDIDQDNPKKEKSKKTKRVKDKAKANDKDNDPKTKAKKQRADGAKKSKGPKLLRRAASARTSVAASSSSKRRAFSAEITDPDFRPDPATRPKIVSPWLEPMPKTTERYMLLCSLDFHSHCFICCLAPGLHSCYHFRPGHSHGTPSCCSMPRPFQPLCAILRYR